MHVNFQFIVSVYGSVCINAIKCYPFNAENQRSTYSIVTNHMILSRLHMTEAALALSEEKNHKVEELLAQLQMETEKQREQQIREGKREQEVQ